MWNPDNDRTLLLPWERCKIVGLAAGFLVVLGLIGYLVVACVEPTEMLESISKCFRRGEFKQALGMCVIPVGYVVGMPIVMLLALVVFYQGIRGKRTRLTTWVLQESSEEECKRRIETSRNRGRWNEFAIPLGMLSCGLGMVVGGVLLGEYVDPTWHVCALIGIFLIAAGLGSVRQATLDGFSMHIPTWLGIVVLLSIVAILPLFAIISWINNR